MTTQLRSLAVASSFLLLGACAADVGSDDGVTTAGGESAALNDAPAERPDRLERRLAHMRARLDLSDAQVEQLRPVLERMRAERRALRNLPPEERREAGRALRGEMRAELEAVLTPDQLERAERMLERRRGHGRWGRHGHRGPRGFRGPPDPEHAIERMREHLDLTDEQAEQVRPILEGAHERREALRDLPRGERREAARSLHEEIEGQLAQVLDDEQMAKLREHFERRGPRGPHRGPRGFRGPPDPDHAIERMREHLDLTDEQAERVRPILEGAHERREALRDLPRGERREAARSLHEEIEGQLAQVLDDEQMAKLREHFERRHRRGPRGHGPRGRGPGPGGFGDAPDGPPPPQAL